MFLAGFLMLAFTMLGIFLGRDPGGDKKLSLMLNEPDIADEELKSIRAATLVLAGSGDLIPEKETRHIADTIPGAELQILKGENHGSYIVHSTKIAGLIRDFARGTREG